MGMFSFINAGGRTGRAMLALGLAGWVSFWTGNARGGDAHDAPGKASTGDRAKAAGSGAELPALCGGKWGLTLPKFQFNEGVTRDRSFGDPRVEKDLYHRDTRENWFPTLASLGFSGNRGDFPSSWSGVEGLYEHLAVPKMEASYAEFLRNLRIVKAGLEGGEIRAREEAIRGFKENLKNNEEALAAAEQSLDGAREARKKAGIPDQRELPSLSSIPSGDDLSTERTAEAIQKLKANKSLARMFRSELKDYKSGKKSLDFSNTSGLYGAIFRCEGKTEAGVKFADEWRNLAFAGTDASNRELSAEERNARLKELTARAVRYATQGPAAKREKDYPGDCIAKSLGNLVQSVAGSAALQSIVQNPNFDFKVESNIVDLKYRIREAKGGIDRSHGAIKSHGETFRAALAALAKPESCRFSLPAGNYPGGGQMETYRDKAHAVHALAIEDALKFIANQYAKKHSSL